MEWIPVFSLIVLVATIGTFIMSISAYIMFKIKEGRRRSAATRHAASMDAEVVSPDVSTLAQARQAGRLDKVRESGPRFVQYTPKSYAQPQPPREQPSAWR